MKVIFIINNVGVVSNFKWKPEYPYKNRIISLHSVTHKLAASAFQLLTIELKVRNPSNADFHIFSMAPSSPRIHMIDLLVTVVMWVKIHLAMHLVWGFIVVWIGKCTDSRAHALCEFFLKNIMLPMVGQKKVDVWENTRVWLCLYIHAHVHMCTYICVCAYVCVCMYVYTYKTLSYSLLLEMVLVGRTYS